MRNNLALGFCLLLAACGPSAAVATQPPPTVAPTQTAAATYTPYPTYTPAPTQTNAPAVVITVMVRETVIRFVTVTPTKTPIASPTETLVPSETPLPSETPDRAQTATAKAFAALTEPRGNGIFLVNVDIAPGVWRNNGSGDQCYWKRSKVNGDIIDNHFGQAGGTIFIARTDFQIEFNGCGRWDYIQAP